MDQPLAVVGRGLSLVFEGHDNRAVDRVSLSGDGKTFAAAYDDALRLWDAATGKLRALPGLSGGEVAFSADGATFAAVDDDRMKLWDASTAKPRAVLADYPADALKSVAFSADGKKLAAAGYDDTVMVWDAETHELITRMDAEEARMVVFSRDGKTLAIATSHTVNVWDTFTNRRRLDGYTALESVVFSPDGETLAAGDRRRWRNEDQRQRCAGSQRGEIGRLTARRTRARPEPRGCRNWLRPWSDRSQLLVRAARIESDAIMPRPV